MNSIPIIKRIASGLIMLQHDVERIARTAKYRYKVFEIPKRKLGEFRTIAQPAFELKEIQSWLVENILGKLPVHDAATAYRKGLSIRENARRHLNSKYLLKMDFRNFFPSIKPKDLSRHITLHLSNQLTPSDIKIICDLVFWKNKATSQVELCIGAPSSPCISNTILFKFDEIIYEFCSQLDVTYTRYADDLAFSTKTKNFLLQIAQQVHQVIRTLQYPTLSINNDKTVNVSKKGKRFLTGITLSSENKISLGRERKRNIRSMIYSYTKNELLDDEIDSLKGYLSFASDIEPEFIDRMKKKYGQDTMYSIMSFSMIRNN